MKKIVIIAFDDFTDIDLFLMWDILGRNQKDWSVEIVALSESIHSTHGLNIKVHHNLSSVTDADAVLFVSGKKGVQTALKNPEFLSQIHVDPARQYIGSICAGAFILNALNLLPKKQATTHPDAQNQLKLLDIESMNQPLVYHHQVATAGGCLAAIYLVGWLIESLFDTDKRRETLSYILPTGQHEIFNALIDLSIMQGKM